MSSKKVLQENYVMTRILDHAIDNPNGAAWRVPKFNDAISLRQRLYQERERVRKANTLPDGEMYFGPGGEDRAVRFVRWSQLRIRVEELSDGAGRLVLSPDTVYLQALTSEDPVTGKPLPSLKEILGITEEPQQGQAKDKVDVFSGVKVAE